MPVDGLALQAQFDYLDADCEEFTETVSGAVLRDSLPRKPSGKILQRELRAQCVRA